MRRPRPPIFIGRPNAIPAFIRNAIIMYQNPPVWLYFIVWFFKRLPPVLTTLRECETLEVLDEEDLDGDDDVFL